MINTLGELGAGGGGGGGSKATPAGGDALVQNIRRQEAEREARREHKRAAGA